MRPELLLATGLAALWLVATPPLAEPTAGSEPATPERPAFELRPATGERARTQTDPETGDTLLIATPLRALLGQAHGVHPRDVRAEGEVDLTRRYDVMLRPGAGAGRAKTRELLAAGLAQTLQLEIARTEQTGPINRLQRLEEEPPLPPSQATAPRFDVGTGRVEARAVQIRDLAHFLRWHSPRPILDETGLDASYDFVLEWDPSTGPRSLFLSLHDLGLQIVRGRDAFPLLVARPRT
jgi:uncharacterized protein (TIGR03435 family)